MKKTLLLSLAMGLVITGCEKGLDNAVNDETVGTSKFYIFNYKKPCN